MSLGIRSLGPNMSALSLEDQVIVALRRITRAIDLHSRGLMQDFGLTAPQLAALRAVETLQPITAGALARSIHLSQATITGILSRLEKRALVSRSRSQTDRRAIVIELTDAGKTLLQSAPSLLQDRFRRELLQLQQWEQTQMLAALQRIASMMDADQLDAAPVLASGDASPPAMPQESPLEGGDPAGIDPPIQSTTTGAIGARRDPLLR